VSKKGDYKVGPGRPPIEHQFKKGQSGNPGGKPKGREDLKKIKLMSKDDVSRLLQKIMNMPIDDIKAMVKDPKTPALELMFARLIDKALSEGDRSRLDFLMERTVGKVVEEKNVNVRPVTYVTEVKTDDGTLIQDAIEEDKEQNGEAEPEGEPVSPLDEKGGQSG
jgi:hypothetical protein